MRRPHDQLLAQGGPGRIGRCCELSTERLEVPQRHNGWRGRGVIAGREMLAASDRQIAQGTARKNSDPERSLFTLPKCWWQAELHRDGSRSRVNCLDTTPR
jgi:hypothetical protein